MDHAGAAVDDHTEEVHEDVLRHAALAAAFVCLRWGGGALDERKNTSSELTCTGSAWDMWCGTSKRSTEAGGGAMGRGPIPDAGISHSGLSPWIPPLAGPSWLSRRLRCTATPNRSCTTRGSIRTTALVQCRSPRQQRRERITCTARTPRATRVVLEQTMGKRSFLGSWVA